MRVRFKFIRIGLLAHAGASVSYVYISLELLHRYYLSRNYIQCKLH